jgi:hypothetical protein
MAKSNSVVLVQGRTEETPISIGGMNESTTDRTMQVINKSLPRNGVIFAGQQILRNESVIPLRRGESHVVVSCQSTNDAFFSLPQSLPSNAIPMQPTSLSLRLRRFIPSRANLSTATINVQ